MYQFNRCNYPNCGKKATTTWALVPLCADHREAIQKETALYYRGSAGASYEKRTAYHQISHLIPWSRRNMGEVLPDGTKRWD